MTEVAAANIARVEAGFEAFDQGDVDAVLAFFDEDIEIYGSPGLVNSGRYRGHAGYQEWLAQWLEVWDGFEAEIEKVDAVGDRHVVAGVRQHARGKGSGIEVEMRIGYMFELGEMTTMAMHLYPSWDEAIAVAREREAAE